MASNVGSHTGAVDQKRVSRKAIFAILAGSVLGIVILTFDIWPREFARMSFYYTTSNLTDNRDHEILKFALIRAGVLQDQTTTSEIGRANKLAEVSPITTTMTFNKSLEVRCKESPFIECLPPLIKVKSGEVFTASFLRQPSWESLNLSKCRYKQCQFVDTKITRETDLVVVYGVGLNDNYKPPQRWSHQLYVISMWESPMHTHADFLTNENATWNSQFNLTITYRVDSDIFSPYNRFKYNPQSLEKRPDYREIARNKTKTAVWIVSHCETPSKRETYVKEMQKYIDVDILGACGQPCSKNGVNCDDLSSTYKFYLSFENSLCTDYVTEKFFKLFVPGNHVIPVARGGADYDKYFPNFTFINAAHFKTPKDLALHLKNLAEDLETYSKYLEYKDLYEQSRTGFEMACNICEFLHTRKSSQPKMYNLKSWAADGHCHSPTDM